MSGDDNDRTLMKNVTTTYVRPWTRFNLSCVYRNNINETSEQIHNTIKKLNVRRKAEILQYKQGNTLTKAQKYSNFANGINKFNKKQYAYQTLNRVPGNTPTTDPNPYNLNAFGVDGKLDKDASDWLSENTEISRLVAETNNPTGITLLTCNKVQGFQPTPLSSSDVPRISNSKLKDSDTNPFPVIDGEIDSINNPLNNTLYMNKSDNLVNYTPVKRTYKGGSEKWPQTTWKEGDKGFPVGKKGSKPTEPEPEPEPEVTVNVFDYIISSQSNINAFIDSNPNITETTINPKNYIITTSSPIKNYSSNLDCQFIEPEPEPE